ncbi:unnamed protein product [Knipowitschia caucasica]
MSGTKPHAVSQGHRASAAAPECTEIWKNVPKFTGGKTPENIKTRALAEHASPRFTDLQSPKRRGAFLGVSNGDSPGDVEPSQDIIWDSTSPTQGTAGRRYTKVEISDLVNRIAPKDVKPQKSPLLQWIGDSAVPCTPEIPKQRTKKRSSRQNSVDDLMKLAKQFDENMQQDKDKSEKLNIINNNANPKENVISDLVEAELQALFDSSTQKISGPLSQASTSSASSPEVAHPPIEPLSQIAPETNKCDDFDDDWENELLNDSALMALTQNPEELIGTTKVSMQSYTKCVSEDESSSNANHAPKESQVHTVSPSYSALQALCPKLKTTNRSTFKLGPDPVIRPPTKPAESKFTALKSLHHTEPTSTVTAEGFSDSLWDDEDDALLYEVCDTVEKISNSQPYNVNQSECQNKCELPTDRVHKVTSPLPIISTNTCTDKQPSSFVRSNSLPVTSSTNYQGWNNLMHGSSITPQVSQSLPGKSMGSFSRFNHNNNNNTNKSLQKSSHTAFKRNVSDSAVICNKVFVTSEVTGKCSAAQIEKKKQEALARRRQRLQNF